MTQLTDRPRPRDADVRAAHRYGRDTLEFGRVVNLSDAVFAIALTLLVLDLRAPAAADGQLGAALATQTPKLLTFGLSFFLVAGVWWQHHRILARLAWLEPGLVAINLGLIAAVALVPFPTSVLGSAPTSRAAVIPFIVLFAVLSLLCLTLILRAHRLDAWQTPLAPRLFRWVLADWLSNLSVHAACLVVAVWAPLLALAGVAVGSSLTALTVTRMGPTERRAWF